MPEKAASRANEGGILQTRHDTHRPPMNRSVIFISAVSRELRTARDLVAKTLLSLGYEPKWQDITPAETGDLRSVLRKWVDDSAALTDEKRDPRECARVQHRIAYVLDYDGKSREAEPIHRHVVEVRQRVLGAEHPDVFQSCYNLAVSPEDQRKLPDALAFIQRAEAGWTKVLGPDHPDSKDAKQLRERIKAAMRKP